MADDIDLDAIKRRIPGLRHQGWYAQDVPALVAEVERLQREVAVSHADRDAYQTLYYTERQRATRLLAETERLQTLLTAGGTR
ncbi:MAG TPA: hypothetical protein VGH54_21335 [Mycobacterium sp.]|jgi:hypothetical protein|uniref:hypothetical protein n=1 Tax=Mycobacterium sp. TaxID=1785 RepID=UPI002F41C581